MTADTSQEQSVAAIDLTGHEPVLHVEDEGLDIRGYEIDGEFILDFDWQPGSRWSFLDEEAKFKAFVVSWLEEMTGEPMEPFEIESLQIARSAGVISCEQEELGEELAGSEEQQGGGCDD